MGSLEYCYKIPLKYTLDTSSLLELISITKPYLDLDKGNLGSALALLYYI